MDATQINQYLVEGPQLRSSLDVGKILNLGNELIIFGNGGSAADAQHIAAEFVGRFEKEKMPMPALVLHRNTSSLTAIGNDYGFDQIYSRQIRAFATKEILSSH